MKTMRILRFHCDYRFPFDTHKVWHALLVVFGMLLATSRVMGVGAWTPLANPAPGAVNLMLLLPDGTVMAAKNNGTTAAVSSNGTAWYRLAPDSSGHYANGTWSNRAPMRDYRLFFGTQVLPSGKVFVAGSEHPLGSVGGNSAQLYDPVSDSWTNVPVPAAVSDPTRNSPFSPYVGSTYKQELGSPNSMQLSTGGVMMSPEFPNVLNGTVIYYPAGNVFSNGPASLGSQYEASWLKLPDNSILTIDNGLNAVTSTNSERFIPSLNRWIRDARVPVPVYTSFNLGGGATAYEIGAALLLPSGKGLFIGGNGNTAIYTPSGTTNAGTWTAGASMPNGLGVADGPAAMLANGKVLCVGATNFNAPCTFFEYDPVGNAFTAVNSPNGLTNNTSFPVTMLDLPDGTVLCANQNAQLYVYTPDTAPLASSKPTIGTIVNTSYKNYLLTGNLLNGVSAGAAYGDNYQMDGNFPLVRLTDTNNNVYYARTYNWSSTSVMASNVPVTTSFVLPPGLSNGIYSVVVSACGNTSAPVQLAFTNDNLLVIPPQGITFSGPLGGPFSPSSQYYTLTNTGGLPLGWGLNTNVATWLKASTNSGILPGNQAFTNLVLNVTGAATNLGLGTYTANLLITNLTAGTVQNLAFTLTVNPIVQNGDFEYGDFTYWLLGADPNYNYAIPYFVSPNYVYSGYFGAFLGQSATLGTLSQNVVVNTNQYYLLSFWLTLPAPGNNNQFTVSYNGTNLFSQSNMGAFGWVNFQYLVSSPQATNLLQFSFQNDTGAFGLDGVTMVPINLSTNKPLIITQPANQAVAVGQTAGFAVGAIGLPPLYYQWALNNTNVIGATNAVLTVIASSNTAGAYSVTVSNANGSVASSSALLTLLPASLLFNGGFESGSFLGWTVGDTNLVSIGTLKTNIGLVNSGSYSAILGNSNTVGSLSQYIGTEFNQYYLITFTLANTSTAQSNMFNVYWNGVGILNVTNLPDFNITQVQLIAKAPSMLTQLLFTFQNLNGYFSLDDVSVVQLTVPVLRNVVWSQNSVSFDFDALPGIGYQLQYTTDLASNVWTNIGDSYVGTGGPVTAVDAPATDPHRFYRVAVFVIPFNVAESGPVD